MANRTVTRRQKVEIDAQLPVASFPVDHGVQAKARSGVNFASYLESEQWILLKMVREKHDLWPRLHPRSSNFLCQTRPWRQPVTSYAGTWCKSLAVFYTASFAETGRETPQITSLRKMSLPDFLYLVAGLSLDFLLGMQIRVSEVDLCCDLPALHHSIGGSCPASSIAGLRLIVGLCKCRLAQVFTNMPQTNVQLTTLSQRSI